MPMADENDTESPGTLMREMLDHMDQGVVLYRRDTAGLETVAFFNAKAASCLELPDDMLVIGLARRDIIDVCVARGDHEVGFDPVDYAGRASRGEEVEVIARRPSGRWILNRSLPRMASAGSLTLYIDISETILNRQRLQKSRTEYRTMAETAPIGFLKLDERRRPTFANSAALRLFEVEEPARIDLDDLEPADEHSLADAMANEDKFEVILRRPSRDRHLLVSVSPWSGSLGGRERMLALTDVSALKEARLQIEHMAHHDPLTGLGNRSLFNASWARLERTSGGYLETGILIALDLDYFKRVNDEHGHAIGDRLLRAVAGRILSICSPDCQAFRLGGDEFAIVCTDADRLQVMRRAQALVASLSERFVVGEHTLTIGCSAGIASMPADGLTIEQVQRAADVALYEVKRNGRNGVAWYDPHQQRETGQQRRLEADLASAMARQELTLAYEPQVDLRSRDLCGLQVRIVWHNARVAGAVDARTIAALAATAGLAQLVDAWLLATAIADFRMLLDAGLRCYVLSLSLSTITLAGPEIVGRLGGLLDEYAVDATRIEIAISERGNPRPFESIRATVEALRAMGVKIAIEDFGGRSTSLASIRTFPIDRIKIDGGLVRTMGQDPTSASIIGAIKFLGAGLGAGMTATGVENEAQAAALCTIGDMTAQGSLFGSACSAVALIEDGPGWHLSHNERFRPKQSKAWPS